jgi:DNA-binding transcriptional LysR family regulator
MQLKVAFDAFLPVGRWAPMFHVLCLERPALRLAWRAVPFPARDRPLLDGADAGLFVAPPPETGLDALTIDTSPMAVSLAVGHRLARAEGLAVADILDEPFLGGPTLHPQWLAFWTLDERRGGPPRLLDEPVHDARRAVEVVASGRAIATVAAWMGDGLAHPGVITIPLRDGPPVHTRLVWRSGDRNANVHALVDLAAAWSALRPDGGDADTPDVVASPGRAPTVEPAVFERRPGRPGRVS